MTTLYLSTQLAPDEAAIERAGLAPTATDLSPQAPTTTDLPWPLSMPESVSILAVQPEEDWGFRFSIASFARDELDEAELIHRVERWLQDACQTVTVGGDDVGPTVLAMAGARSGVFCPHVAALAMPPGRRGDGHVRLLDEVCGGGAPSDITLDQLCAGLGIPSASSGRSPSLTECRWAAMKRQGEIEAVSMWLAHLCWQATQREDTDSLSDAKRALERWFRCGKEDLHRLRVFGGGQHRPVPSAPLAPSGAPVF